MPGFEPWVFVTPQLNKGKLFSVCPLFIRSTSFGSLFRASAGVRKGIRRWRPRRRSCGARTRLEVGVGCSVWWRPNWLSGHDRGSRHKIAIIPCLHGRLILPKEISGPKTILLGRIFIPMNVAKTSSSIETVHLYRCVRMKFYPEIFSIACTFDGRVCHKINRKEQMSTKSPAPRQDSGAFEEWPRKDKDGRVRPSRSHLACSAMTGFWQNLGLSKH